MPSQIPVITTCGKDGSPDPEEVERLYVAAFSSPPLFESPEFGDHNARLYGSPRHRPDLVVAAAWERGDLIGFAYGHRWLWKLQCDPWERQLFDSLGHRAGEIEDSFAVYVRAVAPYRQRTGFGRRLLDSLLQTAGRQRAWLLTRDEATPAMALYVSGGWAPIGHGPDTSDGRSGVVLAWQAATSRGRAVPG